MSTAPARTRALAPGFVPYVWAPSSAEIAARRGLRPEQIIRFDQNTPPLPGVPQVPLGVSFARLNEYPDGTYRELREAAAGYVGATPEQVVVGAGADDLIALCARTFLAPGWRAWQQEPTYALYRIVTQLEGAELVAASEEADLLWLCNPNNPTGALLSADEIVRLASAVPTGSIVIVDEAYSEFAGVTVAPLVEELGNVVVLRTLSKAFGLAALRVGYAVTSTGLAGELERRRAPAPIAGPAARIAAAALREPRLDVDGTIVERERVRSALLAAGYDCLPSACNFVFVRTPDPLGERLEEQGLVVRHYGDGIRVTLRRPAENDLVLHALGAVAGLRSAARDAVVVSTTTETALRLTLDLDGVGRTRVATGIGFLDHLLTLLAFHARFDLELLAAGDLDVDEHHTVEDVLAALGRALSTALGSRDGVARYGSATVPMDEAGATAAVDLVRRPHAEVALGFTGERVGGLALTLLSHALERMAMDGAFTLHVEAAGVDDHHVAESAFKALGRALGQAVAAGEPGVRSTKGTA